MQKEFLELVSDDNPAIAVLATLMADGSPQATPVWFDCDGQYFRINTAKGRTKYYNMSNRSQVALTILDPNDPYKYLQIRGRVEAITEEGAVEHIHKLAEKYTGERVFKGLTEDQVRVIFMIKPLD